MSWERAEHEWDVEAWESAPKPWPRHLLFRWLRHVDSALLRGARYYVPPWCCSQVKSAAHEGRAPGKRAIVDVAGCSEWDARKHAAALVCVDPAECVEPWRDPHKRRPDPEARIRQLEAELEAARASRAPPSPEPPGSLPPSSRPPPGSLPGSGRKAQDVPDRASRVPPALLPPSSRVPPDRASSPRASTDPPITDHRSLKEGTQTAGAVEGAPAPQPARAPLLPKWVPPSSACGGHARDAVMAMVVQVARAAHGDGKDPSACGTAAKPVLALWNCLGAPSPESFAANLGMVIAWARLSRDPLAENDIRGMRANGERWGSDRSRDLSTLCVQDRWDARLAAAKAWEARGRLEVRAGPRTPAPSRVDERRRTLDGLAALEAHLQTIPLDPNVIDVHPGP